MFKRIICVLLTLIMCLGSVTFAKEEKIQLKAADFSNFNSIVSIGMPASSVYKKSGDFTLKWADSDITKRITAPSLQSDFTLGEFLEFYLYSGEKTESALTVALVSDNSATTGLDYYYTDIEIGYTGWKYFSLAYTGSRSVFKESGTPAGLNNISQIRLWADKAGEIPLSQNELYLDSFYITNQKTEVLQEAVEEETKIIKDFSASANIAEAGFPASTEQVKSGDVSLKWADPNLKKTVSCTGFDGDWAMYNSVAITMFNKEITGSTVTVLAYSQNDAVSGSDYYSYTLPIDFTGWKTILIPKTDFKATRSPKGWNQITSFALNTTWGATEERPCSLMDGTEIFIDKIFVTTEEEIFDNSIDYIFPHFEYEDHVDVASKVKELHSADSHPRFHFNQQELDEIRELIKTDVYAKKSYENLISTADGYLNKPVQTYEVTADGMPRTPEARLPAYSMAFLLSGDEKYKNRLWEELESICLFPDWHPQKMLDVGNYGLPVAIAYDWLYDYWTPEQRRTIRNALVRHCIEPGVSGLRINSTTFAASASNWNQVVNSAIGLSALAIADEEGYEDIANEAINLTCKSLPISLAILNPDGGTHEGVTYWEYGVGRFLLYHAALLNCANYDFGLSNLPGLRETGYFPISMMGPTKQMFNYGDASSSLSNGAHFFHLARLYNKPELAGYLFETKPNGGGAYDLALYRPSEEEVNFKEQMPLDMVFESADYVASVRSSWNDTNALYAGFIAGNNMTGHGDMDIGSFILEALGTRWITDFGQENYNGAGYFQFGIDGGRWKFYRKGAEGHNVAVMNPTKISADAPYKEGQNPLGAGKIEPFKTSSKASYGIIDMTDAYSRDVNSYKRGFALINNRSQFVIRDEIETKKASEFYSFFHTQQKIHIDDPKTAYMYTGIDYEHATTKIRFELLTDADGAEFIEMEAKHIVSENAAPDGYDNPSHKKLAVHIPSCSNPIVSVVITPMLPGQEEVKTQEIKAISAWDSYLGEDEVLTSVMVDGVPLNGFTSFNTNYSVNAGVVGNVTATGANGVEVKVTQAQNIGDTAFVTATKSGITYTYTVTFNEIVPSGQIEPMEVASIKASDVPQVENGPENTIDGDITTRWAADSESSPNGEQWFVWDMGTDVEFDTVYLAFWKGNVRNQKFKLLVSNDDVNYTTVFDGQSSGKSEDLLPYAVGKQKARYIKFVGYGNTSNSFNSVNEFVIPKVKGNFSDMQNHWAKLDVSQLANAGIVKGVSETEFNPEAMVTRAEFAELLYRTMAITDSAMNSKFADVDKNEWYFNSVNVLSEKGYIPQEMIANGNFDPNKPITREEICSLVMNAYESSVIGSVATGNLGRFADSGEIAEYAKDSVDKAVTLHVIKGVTDSAFQPKALATRAQAATILKRFFSVLNMA
ncbi:MAG: S-layer homology domain-containing protein [Clostridia bacterium]|nr:S-layer homology domain-containing protein [Clostridia bacterium]